MSPAGPSAVAWHPHPDTRLELALQQTPTRGLHALHAHPAVQADPYARLRVLDRLHAAFPHDAAAEQQWLQQMLIGNRYGPAWAAIQRWPAAETLDLPRLLLSAQVAQVIGEGAEARRRYGVALRRFPDAVDVWQKSIDAGDAGVTPSDAEGSLRRMHDDGQQAYDREKAAFALATLLDREHPGEAFAWASRAHTLKRERLGAWRHDAYLAALAADRAWRLPSAEIHSGALRPVFVVGLPRSGTTLLSALLAEHPCIANAGEQNLLPTLAFGACRDAAAVDTARLQFCADWYRAALGDLAAGADIIVDKLPANATHCGLILSLFPDALILHCHRDLRDTAISIWQHDFEYGCLFGDDADDLARYAEALHAHVDYWRRIAPARVIDVAYEAVVDDPAITLAPVLQALGLTWRDAMAEFWRGTQPVATFSERQLRQPINRRSIQRWRRYLPQAADFLNRIAPD